MGKSPSKRPPGRASSKVADDVEQSCHDSEAVSSTGGVHAETRPASDSSVLFWNAGDGSVTLDGQMQFEGVAGGQSDDKDSDSGGAADHVASQTTRMPCVPSKPADSTDSIPNSLKSLDKLGRVGCVDSAGHEQVCMDDATPESPLLCPELCSGGLGAGAGDTAATAGSVSQLATASAIPEFGHQACAYDALKTEAATLSGIPFRNGQEQVAGSSVETGMMILSGVHQGERADPASHPINDRACIQDTDEARGIALNTCDEGTSTGITLSSSLRSLTNDEPAQFNFGGQSANIIMVPADNGLHAEPETFNAEASSWWEEIKGAVSVNESTPHKVAGEAMKSSNSAMEVYADTSKGGGRKPNTNFDGLEQNEQSGDDQCSPTIPLLAITANDSHAHTIVSVREGLVSISAIQSTRRQNETDDVSKPHACIDSFVRDDKIVQPSVEDVSRDDLAHSTGSIVLASNQTSLENSGAVFSSIPVHFEIILKIRFNKISDFTSFKMQLIRDLSSAAMIPLSSLECISVRQGSVIADMTLTTPPDGRSPLDIVQDLIDQIKDNGSKLRQGKYSRYTIKIAIKNSAEIAENSSPPGEGQQQEIELFQDRTAGDGTNDIPLLTERLEQAIAAGHWLEVARLSTIIAGLNSEQVVDNTGLGLETDLMAALLSGDWASAAHCSSLLESHDKIVDPEQNVSIVLFFRGIAFDFSHSGQFLLVLTIDLFNRNLCSPEKWILSSRLWKFSMRKRKLNPKTWYQN